MAADIEQMVQCKSWSTWTKEVTGKSGETYVISHGLTPWANYQYGMECTCKGFQFRKTCKHVKQAESENECCLWHQQYDGGYLGDGKCPKCGGPVEAVMCAV